MDMPVLCELLVHVQIGAGLPTERVLASADAPVAEGDAVGLVFRRDQLHLFEREGGARV